MSDSVRKVMRPAVLLTATTWWPLSARLAVRFIHHGCNVSALCPRGHALQQVSGVGAIYPYLGRDSAAALKRAIVTAAPDFIIPCDDRAVWQLHDLYGTEPGLRDVLGRSLGAAQHFETLRSRVRFLEVSQQLGVRVPRTASVGSEHEIQAWFTTFPGAAVMKLDGTSGGHGVEIVRNLEQALAAWRRFTKPAPIGLSWKRWIINRDPLAFWRAGKHTACVSVQEYVPGQAANAMLACWDGEVLGMVSAEVLNAQGTTGASTIVRIVQNAEIEHVARTIAQSLGLSGFFGLDFILRQESKAPFLIELNARCTQLGHLVLPEKGDLVSLICAKLGAGPARKPDAAIQSDVVAFFPQALIWSSDSPHLATATHDVPWGEPRLLRELLLDPWPDRIWLTRLYHRFRRGPQEPPRKLEDYLRQMGEPSDASHG